MNLAEQLIERVRKQRKVIVVVGDTICDRWVHGRRAPSQDGCDKFVQEGEVVTTPGGAENAANCLRHWQVGVHPFGYASNDCPVKTRYVEDGVIVFRADDDGSKTRGAGYGWARSLAFEMVKHADAVLLSDYDKGFLTTGMIAEMSDLCKDRGIPCVADAKREPRTYTGCIIKGNDDWRSKWTEWDALKDHVITYGVDEPVVNDYCIDHSFPLPTDGVNCVNHVGAGDCFAAHLTLALAYGFSLKEAATIAHSAGRVYVQYPHNRPPYPAEVVADMALAMSANTAPV